MSEKLKLRKLLLQLISVGFFSLLIGFIVNSAVQIKAAQLQNELISHQYLLESTLDSFDKKLNENLQLTQIWGDKTNNIQRKNLITNNQNDWSKFMTIIKKMSKNKNESEKLNHAIMKLKWSEWKLFDIELNTDNVRNPLYKYKSLNKYYDLIKTNMNYFIYRTPPPKNNNLIQLSEKFLEDHFLFFISFNHYEAHDTDYLDQLYKTQQTTIEKFMQSTDINSDMKNLFKQYLSALKIAINARKKSSTIDTEKYFYNNYLPAYKNVKSHLKKMSENNQVQINKIRKYISALNIISASISLLLMISFAIFSTIFIRRIMRYVLKPAKILSEKMIEAIHSRNIDIVTPTPALDEFDQLFSQFKSLISQRDFYEKNLETSRSKIEYISQHDPLTKLPNSPYFSTLFEKFVSTLSTDEHIILIVLKIENHEILSSFLGDTVLGEMIAQFAGALSTFNHKKTIYGKLFDTSFLIAIRTKASLSIENVLQQLNQHIVDFEIKLFDAQLLRYMMGVSVYPDNSQAYDMLVRYSRYAATKSVIEEDKHYKIFDQKLEHELANISTLEKDFITGLNNNEFYLMYQPQCDAISGKVVGFEALLRWNHPELGEVSPDIFITVAEKTNFIRQLTNFVLETTLSDYHQLPIHLSENLKISMNASLIDLLSTNYLNLLLEKTNYYNVPPTSISIEVTETMINFSPKKIGAALDTLTSNGFSIAMDDFGSGYSSLKRLYRYAFDFIKIDKGFLDSVAVNDKYKFILKAILEMTHQLGAKSIMEGVETESQLKLVKEMGCDYIQGFYFSKPLKFDEFEKFLKQR